MANDVKWIKITTDMFDNRKIRHLRRLPEGDSIVLIWVMLLTMAGRCNSGGMIFLTENIPYTPKMLADELDFEESTVQLAIASLDTLGMIKTDNTGFLAICGWEEHQNIEGLEKIRDQARKRVARYRENQKLLQGNVTGNVTVTQGNAPDIDKEGESEKEDNIYSPVVEYLNLKAKTKYRPTTSKTQTLIRARVAEGFTLEDFKTVIDKQCDQWLKTDMEKYLRPETLFGPKFEGYLNANNTRKGGNNETTKQPDAITDQVGTWL